MTASRSLPVLVDVYEMAYLAGGPSRAVETALVALLESGRLAQESGDDGQLTVVDARRGHPVEAAVLDAVGRRLDRSGPTVCWRAESDPRVTELARRLELDGLLRPAGGFPGLRRHAWSVVALTAEGRRTLRRLRSSPPVELLPGGTSAVRVALSGVGAMTDPAQRAALFPPPPARAGWDGRPARRADPYSDGHHSAGGWFVFGGDFGGCGDGGGGGGGGGGDGGGC